MLTLQHLTCLPTAGYANLDPVEVNRVCAEGLPGAPAYPITEYQQIVDAFASHVLRVIQHDFPIFQAKPEQFHHSLSVFYATELLTALQRDVGIHYNPNLIGSDDFFFDARNLFLHGVIETKKGTCSSLPRLYVTVGRRLGYPLRFVKGKCHLFARWDSPGERFNIECTTAEGLVSHSNDEYLQFCLPTTKEEAEKYRFLQSLSPVEEVGLHFATRADCLLANYRYQEAAECFAIANELYPTPLNEASMEATMYRWHRFLDWSVPFHLPDVSVKCMSRKWPKLPAHVELKYASLCGLEKWVEDAKRKPSIRQRIERAYGVKKRAAWVYAFDKQRAQMQARKLMESLSDQLVQVPLTEPDSWSSDTLVVCNKIPDDHRQLKKG